MISVVRCAKIVDVGEFVGIVTAAASDPTPDGRIWPPSGFVGKVIVVLPLGPVIMPDDVLSNLGLVLLPSPVPLLLGESSPCALGSLILLLAAGCPVDSSMGSI